MSTTPTDGPQDQGEDPARETGATPPPPPPPPGQPAGQQGGQQGGERGGPHAVHRDLGSLRRSSTDRHIAGVAGGLARHFDIDPIIVRVALVVLVFFGGAGLLLYGAAWLLVPQDDEPTAVVTLDERSRSFALYVVGAIAVLMLLGDTLGHFHMPWPVLIIALIVVVLVAGRRQVQPPGRRDAGVAAQTTTSGQAATFAPMPPDAAPFSGPGTSPLGVAEQTAPVATYTPQGPVNPRRRGPILFWFTLALVALAEGVLGIVDLAGADVAPPAYAALAVGAIGLMLVVGAFWGRAGGLIFLGLIASLVLAGSLAANKWQLDGHSRSVTYTPTTSSAVIDDYHLGTGDLTVDLSGVADPATLAGRTIEVSAHVGTIEVIVPSGISTDANAQVRGPGAIALFGETHGGLHTRRSSSNTVPGVGLAPLTIDSHLNVGKITVETSDER